MTADYPVGGTGAIVGALVRGLEKNGGTLRLGTHVEQVCLPVYTFAFHVRDLASLFSVVYAQGQSASAQTNWWVNSSYDGFCTSEPPLWGVVFSGFRCFDNVCTIVSELTRMKSTDCRGTDHIPVIDDMVAYGVEPRGKDGSVSQEDYAFIPRERKDLNHKNKSQ